MSARIVFGAVVAGVYVAVALASFGSGLVPVRPLYDGVGPPPPYLWVSPPPDAPSTDPATGTTGEIRFDDEGSVGLTLTTEDGQASAIFDRAAVEPLEGEDSVSVEVEPLDPSGLGEPPEGMRIDGNAYRIEAAYAASGDSVRLASEISIVLRFPVHATTIVRLGDGVWREVAPTQVLAASLQLFGRTDELGTFAAAGPPPGRTLRWRPIALAAAGLGAAVAGWYYGRRPARRGPGNRAQRRRGKR